MSILLRTATSRRFHGQGSYLITYDYAAGTAHRYTVLLFTTNDPLVIGRELTLTDAKSLIVDYEETFEHKLTKAERYVGTRQQAMYCMHLVKVKRSALNNVCDPVFDWIYKKIGNPDYVANIEVGYPKLKEALGHMFQHAEFFVQHEQ